MSMKKKNIYITQVHTRLSMYFKDFSHEITMDHRTFIMFDEKDNSSNGDDSDDGNDDKKDSNTNSNTNCQET